MAEAREHFRAAYEINPREADYRAAVQARAGDKIPPPPALGLANIFTRRKSKVNEVRFVELLWRELDASSISPAQLRKSPRK
jgi:hypothetical protein